MSLCASGNPGIYMRIIAAGRSVIASIARNLAFDRLRLRARQPQSPEVLNAKCSAGVLERGQSGRRLAVSRAEPIPEKGSGTIPFEQRHAIELAYFRACRTLRLPSVSDPSGHCQDAHSDGLPSAAGVIGYGVSCFAHQAADTVG